MAILKKAQIETFGLLIIVILLVFIAIFIIRLSLYPSQDNLATRDSTIANNLVTSLSKVTICEKQQLSTIIKNCYNNKNSCQQDSCQLLNKELPIMINNLGFSQQEYKLIISTKEKDILSLGSCNLNANVIASSPYTIYLDGNSAIMKVFICK